MTTSEMGAHPPGRDLGATAHRDEDRSIGEILSDVTTDLSTLMRQELELAKAELKQTATRAGTGAGLFGGAAVAAHMVLLFLSIALWWSLGMLIGHGWSGLIVAVIWAIIAAILAVTGRGQLASARGIPQTTETVAKIPGALKGDEPASPYQASPGPTYPAGPETSYPAGPGSAHPANPGSPYPATTDYPGNGQENYR